MELDIEVTKHIESFKDSYAFYRWGASLTEHTDMETGVKLYSLNGYVVDSRIGDDIDMLRIEFLFDYPQDPRDYLYGCEFPLFDGIRSVIKRVHDNLDGYSLDVADAKVKLKILAGALCTFFETVHRYMLEDYDVPAIEKDKFGVFPCVIMYEGKTIVTSPWLRDELITNKPTENND